MELLFTTVEKPLHQHPESIIEPELYLLEEQLKEAFDIKENNLFGMACDYLKETPGKRLRPGLVFLSGRVTGGDNNNLITLAAAVELLHMATLLHDDIIDDAEIRRGRPSANKKFGNKVAVLLGDYCYGKSLEYVSLYGDEYTQIMAEVINKLVAGEFLQISSTAKPSLALNNYWDRIYNKTAFFFASCCRMGAMASKASESTTEILGQFGECLGIAYQIRDDLLDLTGNSFDLGKPIDSDLKNGIITLPLIHALNFSKDREELTKIMCRPLEIVDMEKVQRALEETGALEYTEDALKQYVNLALQSLDMLPISPARSAMEELVSKLKV